VQAFEFLLGFAIVAWVLNLLTIGVGVEDLQTHVDADHASGLDMLYLAFGLDTQLHIISIGAMEDANPLDLFNREGFNVLPRIADQAEASNATPVGEGDMPPIWV
jgi:hypothetical protein